jgi:UDP-3-O-[3-hydroxymyristoyl] glucosamine N-acyltransferase
MINDTTLPLIFLGSNANIYKLYELCQNVGYTIAGIIDDDYFDQEQFQGIPIINSESDLQNKVDFFRNTYQFICATNWIPGPEFVRNREKRHRLINTLDRLNLSLATVISPQAQVSKHAAIGDGVFVDAFATVEPNTKISNHCSMYSNSYLGHNSTLYSQLSRSHVNIKDNTFIHPGITILRSTEENEEVSLIGKDLRKVYHNVIIEE